MHIHSIEGMGVPFVSALHRDKILAITGGWAGKIFSVRSEVHGIAWEAVQVNVEPPDGIVNMSLVLNARQIVRSRANSSHHNPVITEFPFHDVVVVCSGNCRPENHLLTAINLRI